MIIARVAIAFLIVAPCFVSTDAAVERLVRKKRPSSSLRGKMSNRASSIPFKDETENEDQRPRRSLQIEGGDYNEWWYYKNKEGYGNKDWGDKDWTRPKSKESYCRQNDKPDDGYV